MTSESCRNCQACCKELTITTRHKAPHPGAEIFYKARGEKTYYDEEGYLNVVLKNRKCEQLTPFGCKIYDNRPLHCKLFTGKDDPELREICERMEK